MRNLSLNPLWHTVMPVFERGFGVLTISLSALAFYLMATKTPQSSKSFVKYLMLLQGSIVLVDVNFALLSCPLTLFPAPAGLSNGILTWLGFSGHVGVSFMYFSFACVCVSALLCFHYKFESIGRMVGRCTCSDATQNVFRILLLVFGAIPSFIHFGRTRELKGGPDYIKMNFPSLYYLFENPKYGAYAYDRSFPEYLIVFYSISILVVIVLFTLFVYFVSSSFYDLANQNNLSQKTNRLHHQTMMILLVQTVIPMTILVPPIIVFAYSLVARALDPDITNAWMCFQHMHSLVHTSILILINPSYREAIFWPRKKISLMSIPTLRRPSTANSTRT